MISYELAKELKEAGFPQKLHDKNVVMLNSSGEVEMKLPDICLIANPTLSELIESFPNKEHNEFYMLSKNHNREGWFATNGWGISTEGSSPEEAVAKLWLELNKR